MKMKELVDDNIGMNEYVLQNIHSALVIAIENAGKVDDSLQLNFYNVVDDYYYQNDYAPVWSDTGHFKPIANELLRYLDTAIIDGLFNRDYHYQSINEIKIQLEKDSVKKKDAV